MFTEVAQGCSVKKVLLEILQNSQENICAFSCEFCEVSKNTFFHRTPQVLLLVKREYVLKTNANGCKILIF